MDIEINHYYSLFTITQPWTGADPGFSVGGGANPPGRGCRQKFPKISEKLHEIEKILDRRGGGAPGASPLDPPLLDPLTSIHLMPKMGILSSPA